MSTSVPDLFEKVAARMPASSVISNFSAGDKRWGGWGSNSRPADYEKYGPMHRTRHLHGYHGAVLPMALSALVAQMARSTNRSTAAAPDPSILLLCVTSLAG